MSITTFISSLIDNGVCLKPVMHEEHAGGSELLMLVTLFARDIYSRVPLMNFNKKRYPS